MKKLTLAVLLSIPLVLAMSSAQARIDFYLCAKPTTVTMPDGGPTIPMWGYGSGGSLINGGLQRGAGQLLEQACNAPASSPGPELIVPSNQSDVRIHIRNQLPNMNGSQAPTSVVINGQRTDPKRAPVFVGNRVRSLTFEATSGTDRTYRWRVGFRPGTYLYQSGTHPQVQVQMGLFGVIKKESAASVAYPGVPYDNEVTLLYSEIDQELHDAVAADDYGPGKSITSTLGYQPDYFLVNGAPYSTGTPAISAGAPGETTLIRFLNAGLQTHVPVLQGAHMNVIAEDGYVYPYPREQYSVQMTAQKTKDAIVMLPAQGTYPIYDRSLDLTNSTSAGPGGLISFLSVGGGTGTPPVAVSDIGSVAEGGTLNVAAPGVLGNDTLNGVTTATLVNDASNGALTFPGDGSYDYTHNGGETSGDSFSYSITNVDGTSQATVNLTITPVNDAPVAVADTATTNESTAINVDVLGNDTDAESNTLSVASLGPVTGPATVTNNTTDVTVTPSGAGIVTFDYTVNDNGMPTGSDTATVTVTVNAAVNQAPQPAPDQGATAENTVLVLNILGNDIDDGQPVDPADFTDPPGGANIPGVGEVRVLGKRAKLPNGNNKPKMSGYPIKVTKFGGEVYYIAGSNGEVNYTPPLNFRGTDIFNYKLKDAQGLLSSKAKVKINVN